MIELILSPIHRCRRMTALFLAGLCLTLLCTAAAGARPILVVSVALDASDGPDAALLKAVAARLNLGIHFQNAPFKRRLMMMKNGDLDLVCGLLKHPERETYIRYIEPAYKNRSDTVFFVPKGRAGHIQKYEDLSRLKIGTVTGAKYFPRFDNDPNLNKDPVHQHTMNFRKLLLGRIDTLISNEAAGIDFIYSLSISDQVEMAAYRFNRKKHVYFGLSKKSRYMADLSVLETEIKEMVASGKIRRIIRNYYTRRGLPVPFF